MVNIPGTSFAGADQPAPTVPAGPGPDASSALHAPGTVPVPGAPTTALPVAPPVVARPIGPADLLGLLADKGPARANALLSELSPATLPLTPSGGSYTTLSIDALSFLLRATAIDPSTGLPATRPWVSLGLTQETFAQALNEAPEQIASLQLGHVITPDAYAALGSLPGPIGALLGLGQHPLVALTVYDSWTANVLGGADPVSGQTLPPLWENWGFGSAETFDRTVSALTGRHGELRTVSEVAGPNGAARLTQTAADLLGATPLSLQFGAPSPPTNALLSDVLQALVLGLSDGARAGSPGCYGIGLGGLVRISDSSSGAPGAFGAVAVRTPGGSTLFAQYAVAGIHPSIGTDQRLLQLSPDLSLVVAGGPYDRGDRGLPLMVGFRWDGAQDNFWQRLGFANLIEAACELAEVLSGARTAVAGLSLRFGIALSGASNAGEVGGTIRFVDGRRVRFGTQEPPPGSLAATERDAPAPRSSTLVTLHLSSGAANRGPILTELLGPHITYEERRAVPIDLYVAAPTGVRCRSAIWRIDDTRTYLALGSQNPLTAAAAAQELYHQLMRGDATIDALRPGQGYATWDGSPLSLTLAGINKRPDLGVALPASNPQLIELLHLPDGTWVAARGTGDLWNDSERHTSHLRFGADATDDSDLYSFAIFGLPPAVEEQSLPASSLAVGLSGYTRARAAIELARPVGWLPREPAERRQEAAFALARHFAQGLRELAETGDETLAAHALAGVSPQLIARTLQRRAEQHGYLSAWPLIVRHQLNLAEILAALSAAEQFCDSVARVLVPGALLSVLQLRADDDLPTHPPAEIPSGPAPSLPMARRILVACVGDLVIGHRTLVDARHASAAYGAAVLSRLNEGDLTGLGCGETIAVSIYLGRTKVSGVSTLTGA